MGPDLSAEAVLERGDYPAPARVVLGVGRRHQHHVEGQADLVAADLDVTFFEDVEEADLDPLGQVGQLVDGEDAPVGPGHKAVVKGELVGQVAAFRHLDWVDFADEVGDRSVGGRQLLTEALFAAHPFDRAFFALGFDQLTGIAGDGMIGVIEDFRTGDDWEPLVEKAHQAAHEPRLGLASFAQENDVVTGQKGVLQGGEDGVVVTDHAFHDLLASGDATGYVGP